MEKRGNIRKNGHEYSVSQIEYFGTDFGTLDRENLRNYKKLRESGKLKNPLDTRQNDIIRSYKKLIKVLFVCHGSFCPAANNGLKWR